MTKGFTRIAPGLAREEGDDLLVAGKFALPRTANARIETFADHRIAMSFALAGLKLDGVTIEDPDCAAKTFPAYWSTLRSLGVELVAA